MKVILEPMCYLFEHSKIFYHEWYKPHLLKETGWSEHELKKTKRMFEDGAVKDVAKARDYELQLSRQLLKDLMTERGIPYDEKEAKRQLLYSRHGKYAIPMIRLVPELCNSLREDLYPCLTDEQIWNNKQALERIKAKILKEQPEQLRLRYVVDSPEELIQNCWPDWIKNETVAATTRQQQLQKSKRRKNVKAD